MEHALQGVVYHRDQNCAIELAGLVAEDVTVCHLALLATKKSVLVMPARLPVVANPSALRNKNYLNWNLDFHIDHKYPNRYHACMTINKYSLVIVKTKQKILWFPSALSIPVELSNVNLKS
uniref:Uncharacterized protein n=1 Tax=Medicago truncatula TaxID=3880 RepID=B7FMH5_MEDTR|nr:unknown [Medicago truncatula]AFK44461.1 unknown [Medicago truncatula]